MPKTPNKSMKNLLFWISAGVLIILWKQVKQKATTGFYWGRVCTFHRLEGMEIESRL